MLDVVNVPFSDTASSFPALLSLSYGEKYASSFMTLLLVEQEVINIPKAMIKKLKRSIFIPFKIINMCNFFLFLHFKKYTNTIPK